MADTSDKNEILIDPADFKSIEIQIASIENVTTRTAVKDGARDWGEAKKKDKKAKEKDENLSIRLLEFLENGIVLEVPALSCAEGHRLAISLIATNIPVTKLHPEGKITLSPSGSVTESEKISKTHDRIAIEFIDIDPVEWNRLIAAYAERQAQIQEFLEAARP